MKLGISVSIGWITAYLKKGLNLTYERGAINRTQGLFNCIKMKKLLINIDEYSFCNKILSTFAWLKKGTSQTIENC